MKEEDGVQKKKKVVGRVLQSMMKRGSIFLLLQAFVGERQQKNMFDCRCSGWLKRAV